MRRIAGLVLAAVALAFGCGSGDDDGGSCGATRTSGLSGQGPTCSNWLECGKTKWRLDCDGVTTGTCKCMENDVEQKQVTYQDAFCPADFSSADFDAHYAAARKACGWP